MASVFQEEASKLEPWQIYVDGSSNHEAGGVVVVIEIPKEEQIEFRIKLEFSPTNNEVEYKALIAGLLTTKLIIGKHITVHLDLQLVVGQVTGKFEARPERMAVYLG